MQYILWFHMFQEMYFLQTNKHKHTNNYINTITITFFINNNKIFFKLKTLLKFWNIKIKKNHHLSEHLCHT